MPTIIEIISNPLVFILANVVWVVIVFKIIKTILKLKSKLKSVSVIHGQNIEEVVPFSKYFNHDYRQFKFLGQPIDGIVFGDDKITFIEIKTVKSQLSEKQRHIKSLVEYKKIAWEEIRT